jgi:hypothetical protein
MARLLLVETATELVLEAVYLTLEIFSLVVARLKLYAMVMVRE